MDAGDREALKFDEERLVKIEGESGPLSLARWLSYRPIAVSEEVRHVELPKSNLHIREEEKLCIPE